MLSFHSRTRKVREPRRRIVVLAMCVHSILFVSKNAAQQGPTKNHHLAADGSQAERLFTDRILPLFKQKCFACHGDNPQEVKGELNMRSRRGLLRGGESGEPALVPRHPESSPLYLAVKWDGLEMPPKANDRLSAEQIELVRTWIADGARWPTDSGRANEKPEEASWDEANEQGVPVVTSGGLSKDWTRRRYRSEDIWAYRPLGNYSVPGDSTSGGASTHPIDAFIQQKLKQHEFEPAPVADRATLIRRLTLDLTGLLPSPLEVDRFLADRAPDAYERLVASLLDRREHAEQMARYWLDVVRYADTSGFSNDFERPNAWRYRDYVVRSFQHDKPFNRFAMEQIAGDEMAPDDSECLIAVGFLRMGPWEHTGMSVAAVTRQQFLDDVTHSVGVTFLGQGLRCAQCHDHKFDPVPTRDYYRIQSVFSPVQFADRDVPFELNENTRGFQEGQRRVHRLLKNTRQLQQALNKKKQARLEAFLKDRGVSSINDLPQEERGDFAGLTELEKSLNKIYTKRIAYFQRELNRFQPLALGVYSGPDNGYRSTVAVFKMPPPAKRNGQPADVHILAGGSLAAPADRVTPGVLSAVPTSMKNDLSGQRALIPNQTDGRRLAFARWVVDPANSLTARVFVNRVWQMHFGTGLVATPNNLGKMGAKPSHPELLDWLTRWFIDRGWSTKQLHALIVTSRTYRQNSEHPAYKQLVKTDPNNELLSYFPPRRMAAEELRDCMLLVSGELNRESGGPGIFPEIHWEVALQPRHIMGAVAPAYQPSRLRAQRNRRSIYAFRYRTLADPMLEVFNKPTSDISCERRDETTVTPQVFALFNSQFAQDRALAMAAGIRATTEQRRGQIRLAFRRAFGRETTAGEMERCAKHLAEMREYHQRHRPSAVSLPRTVEREMFEELTGETFTFTEELDVMEDYQRDLKPWDVDAETRALADLCLVLINSNEFVYVR